VRRFHLALALAVVASTGALGATVPNTRTGSQVVVKRARYCAPADIRVVDGDTPELHVACQRDRAVEAKTRLQELLAPPHRVLIREAIRTDKYGRTLAVVLSDGKDVAPILIGRGLAHPYSGRTRAPWEGC
jgi:endonuclease YncB( thermonuclease family)